MIDLISIHIPKTAGRSFYNILEQVYGSKLSISYKRKDLKKALEKYPSLEASIGDEISIIHGHLYYKEIHKIHKRTNARLICWLRDPVDRVVSNYQFFIRGLQNPNRNPTGYAINKHRIEETLLEYAKKEENRNRMSKFLEGIELEGLFFIGLMENFDQDIERLGKMLDWPKISIPFINKNPNNRIEASLTLTLRKTLEKLNEKDVEIFNSFV